MINWIKSFFTSSKPLDTKENDIALLTLNDIKLHFSNDNNGFKENIELIQNIKNVIDVNKKNIFILDDIEDIVDILSSEFNSSLEKFNKVDKFNVIKMHTPLVGFNMISILAKHDDIPVYGLITDITFGGNERLNGRKIIIDGIDVLILTKMKFDNLKFLIFTGNILSENNVRNYNFALKFEKYFNANILEYMIIKDSAINFSGNSKGIFDNLVEKL